MALHEIQMISDEQSKQAFEKLEIPKIYHPFIQGANNCNTNAMLEKYSGVRINIPPLSVQKDELSIAGEKDGVLAVKAAIYSIWKDMEKKFQGQVWSWEQDGGRLSHRLVHQLDSVV